MSRARSRTGARRLHSHVSQQLQVEIAEMALDEIQVGKKPIEAFVGLVNQCLRREAGWKHFYLERMNAMPRHPQPPRMLELFEAEADAELLAQGGKRAQAAKMIQQIIDKWGQDPAEKGWYLQEMARYTWALNRIEAEQLQLNLQDDLAGPRSSRIA